MKTLTINLTPHEIVELGFALRDRADLLEDRGDPQGARFVDQLRRRVGDALDRTKEEVTS